MTGSGVVVLAGKHEIVEEGNTNLNHDDTASLAEPASTSILAWRPNFAAEPASTSILAWKSNFAASLKSLFRSRRNPRLSLPAPPESSAVSSSSEHSSTRIERMMQLRTECATELEFEIEASKDHWSELHWSELQSTSVTHHGGSATTDPEVSSAREHEAAHQMNAEILESLRRQRPHNRLYFLDCGDDSKIGAKIAEGGQAEIFEAASNCVWKVFKEGTTVHDLRRQLPPALRRHMNNYSPYATRIMYGTVVMNGRFAFLMLRYWGDLRKLIDLRMQRTRNSPIADAELEWNMWCIARGMEGLHKDKIIHRDLKASNVLISPFSNWPKHSELVYSSRWYSCNVADYECSVGVVGTGFWRASEILQAVNDRNVTEDLFTEKSDVYSYAMTCYEMITGGVPFEDVARNNYDIVLRGERPSLPNDTKPWIKALLSQCWHPNPKRRPSFKNVVKCIEFNSSSILEKDLALWMSSNAWNLG